MESPGEVRNTKRERHRACLGRTEGHTQSGGDKPAYTVMLHTWGYRGCFGAITDRGDMSVELGTVGNIRCRFCAPWLPSTISFQNTEHELLEFNKGFIEPLPWYSGASTQNSRKTLELGGSTVDHPCWWTVWLAQPA